MPLLVKIGADLKSFDQKMKRATKDISYLGSKISNAGSTMTRGITLPLIGVAIAAGKVGIDFEAQMKRVAAISLATEGDLQALEDKARELGSTTMFSATKAAEGLENFARAGFEVEESLNAIEPSLNLAIATGVELATVTDIVASAIKGFGLEAKDTAKLTDLLANVTANSKTNLEQLGEAFTYVAPIASALGFSAEDVAEALGLMANAGITGSLAGTTLRSAMTNLAKPTAEAKKAMKALGVTITDAEGNMLPLDDVVGQLRGSFADLTKEEQAQNAAAIFGKRAMSGMLAVINATEEDIDKLADATTNYNGVVKKQADIMQSGSKGALIRLKSAVEELGIAFTQTLLPVLTKITSMFQGLVDMMNKLSPAQKEQIIKIAGLVAAIGPLLLVVGKAISLFGKLQFLFSMVAGGIAGISLPVVAVVAAIAGLVAIFSLLYKNNEGFRNSVNSMWEQVKVMFAGGFEFIKALVDMFVGMFTLAWQNNFFNIQEIIIAGWEYIQEIFIMAIQLITDIFSVFTAMLKGDWQGALQAILTLAQNFWKIIKKVFLAGIKLLLSMFGLNLEELVKNVTEKIDKLKQVFSSLQDKVKYVVDRIKEIWKSFRLPTFSLRMTTKTFFGKSFTFPTGINIHWPKLDWHADGGIFTKPTVLGGHGFGEAGKEAILPLSKLPGLLGLDAQKQGNIIQVYIGDELIMEYIDNALGKKLLGGLT